MKEIAIGSWTSKGIFCHEQAQGEEEISGPGGLPIAGRKAEAVLHDRLKIQGRDEDFITNSFPYYLKNQHVGSWNDIYRHLWWKFQRVSDKGIFGPQKFSTLSEMAAFIGENVSKDGSGNFETNVTITCYDIVDLDDPYPLIRICRNSLLASMRGRKNWIGRRIASTDQMSGVSTNFDNYYGIYNVAQEFATYTFGADPGSNNNDAIWYRRGRRSLWNWPHVGSAVTIDEGKRGAVFDIDGTAWFTVSPAGSYVIEPPFILREYGHLGGLEIIETGGSPATQAMLNSVSVLVYPLRHTSGSWMSWLVVPAGFDTWITEHVDPSVYDLCAKILYRHEISSKYKVIPPHSQDTNEKTMFTHFDGSGESLFFKGAKARNNSYNDSIPREVQICRRNRETGIRSPWVTLGKMRHNMPMTGVRFDPAFKR